MKKASLKLSVTFLAKPKEVFDALTKSKQIAQWSGQKGSVSSKKGGAFRMFDGWVKGKVVEFKPGKSLVVTWVTDDWKGTEEESIVKYVFTPSAKGTKVTLEHANLPNEAEKKSHKGGWKEFVFDPLKIYFSAPE